MWAQTPHSPGCGRSCVDLPEKTLTVLLSHLPFRNGPFPILEKKGTILTHPEASHSTLLQGR